MLYALAALGVLGALSNWLALLTLLLVPCVRSHSSGFVTGLAFADLVLCLLLTSPAIVKKVCVCVCVLCVCVLSVCLCVWLLTSPAIVKKVCVCVVCVCVGVCVC